MATKKVNYSKLMEQVKQGLNCDSVQATSIDFDFSEGAGEGWDYLQVDECQGCGEGVVSNQNPECHVVEGDYEDTKVCGKEADNPEGPMMNSLWGFCGDGPDFNEENAAKIKHLPLCLVQFKDATYLALTGGGMDLSWEIAEAYICLGYRPPAKLRLPSMAGDRLDAKHRTIIAAMRESYKIAKDWVVSNERDLDNTVKYMRKRGREYKARQK